MGKRRFAQVPTSDEEDNVPPPPPSGNSNSDENRNQRKRKKVHIPEEDEEEKAMEPKLSEQDKKKKKKIEETQTQHVAASENEEQEDLEAQPLGEVIRVSGKGRGRKNHYGSFEYDGLQYELEDPVLLVPENGNQKPYVAIIKDITKTREGQVMVTGQWFYRPEEAEKRGGGNWESRDTRELFYSFHRDDVPAESVMHKCVVHFIPLNKQIPNRKQHPGFIVQKVYDTEQRRLFKLTDKDYEDNKQHEIDLLVQKTLARIGDLPDIDPEDATVDHEDQIKSKRLLKRRNVSPLDVSREEEGFSRSQSLKAETPGSTGGSASEYYAILSNFKSLTGEMQRDKWLEKLLQSVQFVCTPVGSKQNDREEQGKNKNGGSNNINESHDKTSHGDASFYWPDSAVPVVAALEKAAHDTLSTDFQKYNQKMRQLTFNLKSNALLARRLLNKELEPVQILNMSPNELKEGLTSEEIASREPEESGRMQMTDARCKRCSEKQVGLIDIIQTGHGDRYQLECVACGNTWYASRDDAATLTIEGPSSGPTVGTAPLATAKFEDVEKNLVSPRGAERGTNDVLKKTTEAFLPALDHQKSFNKSRPEENPATSKAK
ncbi:BAH domain protein [Handroanthus impetiginosus]|uniref:BAH domain protein n=1 Tax=Handroanthus impetiginosus TaxID=429701 RepID=A0A2G9HC86_9LAMI|nr:BAH domain protein [Handroanthus impetiginosus]